MSKRIPCTQAGSVNPQVGEFNMTISIPILDASADTDFVMPFDCEVTSARMRATGIAAHATADTWQLKHGATAISDVVAKTATVEAISKAATLANAQVFIPAGDILRVTAVHNTNVAGVVYVDVIRKD